MSLKKRMSNLLKTSVSLRQIYSKIGSIFIRAIGFFVKTDPSLVLFNSYGGKKYDDSPRALFEAMRNDPRFSSNRFVWAFHNPSQFHIEGADVICTDTLHYFVTALKAGVWITNSGVERGMRFKKKKTIYLNTWHGTPIKRMGSDKQHNAVKSRYPHDIQNAQSPFEAEVFSRAFGIPLEHMLVVGYPRNDRLAHETGEKDNAKRKLGINPAWQVILYAPTFREYERDNSNACEMRIPAHFNKWAESLNNDCIVLLRGHYEVASGIPHGDGITVKDVSDYPSLNDLMLASDILVSDYSSIIFDYAILERPIVLFPYDYDQYAKQRGMYFDIRERLPWAETETELISLLQTELDHPSLDQVCSFREEYVTEYGNATKQTIDALWKLMQQRFA